MTRTGQCMCGQVTYTAETADTFSICYCKMCQRWASGVFMGVPTTAFELTAGAQHFGQIQSSDWAERGFCRECGSNIYYFAKEQGSPSVALGSLDDTTGLSPRVQYFVDKRPEGFALAADTKEITEAECMAFFAPDEEDHA